MIKHPLRAAGKWLFAGFFMAAGAAHFLKTNIYMKAMPPYVPWPRMAVILSGAAAGIFGVMLLLPRFSRQAAWGIIVFLVAVFPANLHMVAHPEIFPKVPMGLLWLRLPFQGVLIFWAYRYTL